MNKPQTIQSPAGEEMVVLSKAEYETLVGSIEDLEDLLIVANSRARLAAGEEELVTDAELDAYLEAPTPLAFWRRKRGLSQAALAEKVGLALADLSQIEVGKEEPRLGVLRDLAAALKVTVDELVG